MSAVWVSWDNHRRSREMSRELEIPFEWIRRSKTPGVGLLVNILNTVRFLNATQADTVVVQNPSLILTVVACFMKSRRRFRVIQDLHSYFSLHIHEGRGLRGKIYRALSLYCIRNADLTVVTNPELKAVIESNGGRGFVLQDAIPEFEAQGVASNAERKVVYVCTYSEDEPVNEVFEAGRALAGETTIYVTGRIPSELRAEAVPPGVRLTDFLSEEDYLRLLESADAVMALTTRDHTLLCGAYEGLAFKKPLILSDKAALKSYFGKETLYVENTAEAIAAGIRRLYSAKGFFDRHAAELSDSLDRDWVRRFAEFKEIAVGATVREAVRA